MFDKKRKDTDTATSAHNRNTRSKCTDQGVSNVDLIMMGLYRLDDSQEEIYRKFVDMLAGFDDFDKVQCVVPFVQIYAELKYYSCYCV